MGYMTRPEKQMPERAAEIADSDASQIASNDTPARYVDCPTCGALTLWTTEDGADEPCEACGAAETWER